jgi:hypothetical protein
MVATLRKRFIIITTVALMLVMTSVVGAINIITSMRATNSADQKIEYISENNGDFQSHSYSFSPDASSGGSVQITKETPFEMRFFVVCYNKESEVASVNLERIASVSKDEAGAMADEVVEQGKSSGYYGYYRYQVTDTAQGKMVVFLDCYNSVQTQNMLLLVSALIGLASVLLVLAIVVALSSRAIAPIAVNELRQMQFITDASHELKTPLAIISANADLVELQTGVSEWTQSIRNQVSRMDSLIKQLITLAKSEEQAHELHEQVEISGIAKELAGEFQPLMKTLGKIFSCEVEEGVCVKGNSQQVRQLITILLENSAKHSAADAGIKMEIHADRKNLSLVVSNESEEISREMIKHLFDRFYRTDKSRSRESGGYGLGLSIAQSIVQGHKGKISAKYTNGWISFYVALPLV